MKQHQREIQKRTLEEEQIHGRCQGHRSFSTVSASSERAYFPRQRWSVKAALSLMHSIESSPLSASLLFIYLSHCTYEALCQSCLCCLLQLPAEKDAALAWRISLGSPKQNKTTKKRHGQMSLLLQQIHPGCFLLWGRFSERLTNHIRAYNLTPLELDPTYRIVWMPQVAPATNVNKPNFDAMASPQRESLWLRWE